jgi:hypothetical protein
MVFIRRNQLTKRISVASEKEAEDTVIKNGKIIVSLTVKYSLETLPLLMGI